MTQPPQEPCRWPRSKSSSRLARPRATARAASPARGVPTRWLAWSMPGKTCASRTQTSSLDLLRRRQVYPMGGESETGRFTRCPSSDRGPGLRAAHQHDRLASQCRCVHKLGCGSAKCKRVCLCARLAPIFKVDHRADGFGTEPAAGDSPGEQRLERDHRPSQRAIGRALRHRGHRDRRQGHKTGAGRVPAPHEQ